jgi:zinc/manganese transport system substrate-binding protein
MHSRTWPLLALALAASAVLAGCTASGPAQSGCQLGPRFAALQTQIPDRVGTCSGPELVHPEMGETIQPTSGGQLAYHAADGTLSFTDGTHTWVLDPNGQAQMRAVDARFSWEFNADGLPLVGQAAPPPGGPCPVAPVRVLAVENFYANLVDQLGGQCVSTTTILSNPDADPHEFQPTATEVRAYQATQLVIENGLGYDDFSDRILSTLSTQPALVRAGDVVGLQVGANPHIWYSPSYVDQIRAAILSQLKALNPDAADYYDAQSAALDQAFTTYRNLVDQITATYTHTPVGATESIFVDMASSTGLDLVSPAEFMQALSEGNDPTARDMAVFQNQITNRQIKVLVYNTQTVTNVTDQLQTMAQQNNIPMVGVSETMPDGAQTFQEWQATQLRLLLLALQKATT